MLTIQDLWGDTVNVAAKMEHTGIPGNIQVSEDTYEKLKNEYSFECRGKVLIAGKVLMFYNFEVNS